VAQSQTYPNQFYAKNIKRVCSDSFVSLKYYESEAKEFVSLKYYVFLMAILDNKIKRRF